MKIQDSLKKGTIEMLVLFLLNSEDMYGYQLRQEFALRSDGYYTLPDASLYPTLYRLMQKGYITETEQIVDRRLRRYYHLEESGKQRMLDTVAEYKRMNNAINMVFSSEPQAVSDIKDELTK